MSSLMSHSFFRKIGWLSDPTGFALPIAHANLGVVPHSPFAGFGLLFVQEVYLDAASHVTSVAGQAQKDRSQRSLLYLQAYVLVADLPGMNCAVTSSAVRSTPVRLV